VPNHAYLVRLTQAQLPARLVLEATSCYEDAADTASYAAGLPVVVVSPSQVRDIAPSHRIPVMAELLVAHVLARFGADW